LHAHRRNGSRSKNEVVVAVDVVDLSVSRGEASDWSAIGRGKSTWRMVAGILSPTGKAVIFSGHRNVAAGSRA
jgi:ABC-type glutathione transport system ATPase component